MVYISFKPIRNNKLNNMNLKEIYSKYGLEKDDFFKHAHYTIVTRGGIEKIQSKENVIIDFEVIECTPNFAAIRATAVKNGKTLQTFASATKGTNFKDGNTTSWYVLEIAEKRAMSRLILRYIDLYKEGFFAEDESEDFKK